MLNKSSKIAKEIGSKIRFMRNIRNITSADMARYLGISRQQLQNYESGLADIKIDRLFEVAKTLDVDVSFFFNNFSGNGVDCSDNIFNVMHNINRIKDPKIKETICDLIKELANEG